MPQHQIRVCTQSGAQKFFHDLVEQGEAGVAAIDLERFREAFDQEFKSVGGPIAFGPKDRTYYWIEVSGRREALCGINFHHSATEPRRAFSMSSLARIVDPEGAAEGWQYLDTMIMYLIPRCESKGVRVITTRLTTKGAKNAFACLEEKLPRLGRPYSVKTGQDEYSPTEEVTISTADELPGN